MKITTKEKNREENKLLTTIMTDFSDSLQHSHILEEMSFPFIYGFSPVTEDGVPIRKLFISNLAQRTSFKDLIKLFSKYGNVESCFLRRNQGNSNYAFVTFHTVEAASRARCDLDVRLHNRDLRIFAAHSWHQPDSIENQYYNVKDKSKSDKKETNEQCQDYIQNDITNTSIQILNDDCLIHIFLQLSIVDRIRIERVCKRWKALSLESWHSVKRLDLSYSMWGFLPALLKYREITTCTIRKVLLRCGLYLNEINLSNATVNVHHSTLHSTLTIVGKLCPNLQKIDVTGLTISPSGINSLINNCHNITKFSLGSTTYVCDIDLQKLFKVNPKLQYLKVDSGKICGRCLLYLPLETIEEIVLECCTSLKEQFLSQAISKLQNLKSLTINKCIGISDNVIQAIGTHYKNLETLDISNNSFILQPNDMLHIAKLTNLKILKISFNSSVMDELLSHLASKCLRLTYLDIAACFRVTNVGIAAIATLPKLEVLIMSYLDLVTDLNLRDMNNLKRLECRSCKFTDQTMINLIESAPKLELLDLSHCSGITNQTLTKAATVTINRTNNMILKIFVGGTAVDLSTFDKVSPFLQIVNVILLM